jgi:hypothetical protein
MQSGLNCFTEISFVLCCYHQIFELDHYSNY